MLSTLLSDDDRVAQLGRLRLAHARPAHPQVIGMMWPLVIDREYPCLTYRSGTQRARRTDPLIRRTGRTVHRCLCEAAATVSLPYLSQSAWRRPSPWQQYWQHSESGTHSSCLDHARQAARTGGTPDSDGWAFARAQEWTKLRQLIKEWDPIGTVPSPVRLPRRRESLDDRRVKGLPEGTQSRVVKGLVGCRGWWAGWWDTLDQPERAP